MADFKNAVMTNAGAELLTKTQAGTAQMQFTVIVSGAGTYSEAESTREALRERTALKDPRQDFPFSSIQTETATCVHLKAVITNTDLQTGYYINEIGIYAKDLMHPEEDAILYSIAVANIADYLQPYSGLTPSTITQEWYTTVSNSAEVTIETGAGALALAEDLETTNQIVDEIRARVIDIDGDMGWVTQDVLALQLWAALYQRAQIDNMADNTVVEVFDNTSGFIIASGDYDSENHRVIA